MQNNVSSNQAANSNLTAYAIRESVFAGIIAFALFFFFIGLETTQNIRNELVIVPHWIKLAMVVALVMAIRFLMITVVRPHLERKKQARAAGVKVVSEPGFFRKNFSVIIVLALFLYPVICVSLVGVQGSLKYVDNFGIQILIYVMLAWGLNIVVGLAGLPVQFPDPGGEQFDAQDRQQRGSHLHREDGG